MGKRGRFRRALRIIRSWLRRKEARHLSKARINKLARLLARGTSRPEWEGVVE
jgi:hypothetical protein